MVRKKLRIELGNKCKFCDYDSVKGILHLHHIDRDPKNNLVENQALLCPNCHALLHMFFQKGLIIVPEIESKDIEGEIINLKEHNGGYEIPIPLKYVQQVGWLKGQKLAIAYDPNGNLVLKEVVKK